MLVVALSCGALLIVGPVDGRSFGALIAHRITCAVRGGCDDGDDELAAAYGEDDAALVRRYAPNLVYERGIHTLPVDPRECREHRCSDAPDDPDLDAHRSHRGVRATVFTRLVRVGGETYIQYWLYYPDSTSTVLNAAGGWRAARSGLGALGVQAPDYPGYHRDDWESYQVRIDAAGRADVRASSHHAYQGCKQRRCKNRWTPWTGWTRISWGSHAGHIPLRSRLVVDAPTPPGRTLPRPRARWHDTPLYPGPGGRRERTTTAPGLRLVPLDRVDPGSYHPLDPKITPPWMKEVYRDPRSDSTG